MPAECVFIAFSLSSGGSRKWFWSLNAMSIGGLCGALLAFLSVLSFCQGCVFCHWTRFVYFVVLERFKAPTLIKRSLPAPYPMLRRRYAIQLIQTSPRYALLFLLSNQQKGISCAARVREEKCAKPIVRQDLN